MDRYQWIIVIILSCLTGFASGSTDNRDSVPVRTIPVVTLSGAIGPAVGDYVIREIQRANRLSHHPAILLTIDTPGGLNSALREINQHILASKIPVLCFVSPRGARAASAGTYILYACHIAAMAPATTLGAATPVQIGGMPGGGGENKDDKSPPANAMQKKILNDSVAYIRSLAQLRGRNVEWAEKAVREAATLSAQEALMLNVIDLIATTPEALLQAIHGRTVEVNQQKQTLDLTGSVLQPRQPDWRSRFLATITDPNIAYILMMIGIYGLLLEFYSPGLGISGVIGAISLLVAMYAFHLLPVNYAGIGLIFLAVALLIAESLVPSFGILGGGGIVALVLGSVFLIDSDLPELQVSPALIYSMALVSAGLILFVMKRLWALRQKPVVSGYESMIGRQVTVTELTGEQIFVDAGGERWEARSRDQTLLQPGDMVTICAVDGLTVWVQKVSESKENDGFSNR